MKRNWPTKYLDAITTSSSVVCAVVRVVHDRVTILARYIPVEGPVPRLGFKVGAELHSALVRLVL